MRLLWFYTAATYASFSTGALRQRNVDVVLKVNVVQHAFANPFLMNCLLGLAAMHINYLNLGSMGVPPKHEIQYRAKAFETYRKAVEAADPATFPALLAASLMLCGLSTHVFRGADAVPLSVLDWMGLWRGISTILDVTRTPRLSVSGVAALVFRPDVDLEASARCLPSHLLFMTASIKHGDPEFDLTQPYYIALKYLGSLYLELRNGFNNLLALRIMAFFTFLPEEFVEAARQRRPRALVILAHYLVFAKIPANLCWWLDGISDFEIPNICLFLGPKWAHLLRMPIASSLVRDRTDIARPLLDDPSWVPPATLDEEHITAKDERQLVIRAVRETTELVSQDEAPRQQVKFVACGLP